jgi:hypothetical protein
LSEVERPRREQEQEQEGLDYVKVSLGLVFVFGAFVFGILAPPGTLVISYGLMIPAVALLADAIQDAARRRRAISSPPANRERELLSAIRDNGGSITPAEAAMETSLTVRGADQLLSQLAGGTSLRGEYGWHVALCPSPEAGARARRTRLRNLTDLIRLRLLAGLAVVGLSPGGMCRATMDP